MFTPANFTDWARLTDARSHRSSSYDRTGGNRDRLSLAPGETAVLLVLLAILRRRWRGVEGRESLVLFLRVAVAALFMSVAVGGVLLWGARAGWGAPLVVVLGGAAGFVAYVAAGIVLRLRELAYLPAVLLKRRPAVHRSDGDSYPPA